MIESIIFDLGGVLITDVPLWEIAGELSERFSIPADELHSYLYPTPHWTRLTSGQITEDEYWDNFLRLARVDVDKTELKKRVRLELRPLEENARVLPLLKPRYKLAALSNHAKEWAEFMQKGFDFFGSFDQIIFSCDVGLRKPDPRIYELALTKLGSAPEECLFVDDKKRNTDAADALGMRTLTLDRAAGLRGQLLLLGIDLGQPAT
jgi:epoxide hydrolase-like predicted phosphatase